MHESNYLKDDISNIHQLLAIPCLRDLMLDDLSSLLRLSKLRHYNAGECIICEGDRDPWFYFLLSGCVHVKKEGIHIAALKKMGDLFGEKRVLDGLARNASVFAGEKTICLAVDTSARHRLNSPDEAKNLVRIFFEIFSRTLCQRLRDANEQLVKAKKEAARMEAATHPHPIYAVN